MYRGRVANGTLYYRGGLWAMAWVVRTLLDKCAHGGGCSYWLATWSSLGFIIERGGTEGLSIWGWVREGGVVQCSYLGLIF